MLIDFVDGNNNWDTGCFHVVDCFNCLRHDTIVGSYYKNGDVGGLGSTCTHGCESFVAGSVKENNLAQSSIFVWHFDVVGANVLSDAAVFCIGEQEFGLADSIQQAGFAVVDVTHDRDDRRSCDNAFNSSSVRFSSTWTTSSTFSSVRTSYSISVASSRANSTSTSWLTVRMVPFMNNRLITSVSGKFIFSAQFFDGHILRQGDDLWNINRSLGRRSRLLFFLLTVTVRLGVPVRFRWSGRGSAIGRRCHSNWN